jgi:hypothetical protein
MKKIILQLSLLVIFLAQALSVLAQVTPGSVLASSSDNATLSGWLSAKGAASGTLLYRKSTNGATAATFHSLCDNQGPTLVLYKTSFGNVFGGYNGISWNSKSTVTSSSSDFIFNLTASKKARVTTTFGTFNAVNYGPTFGGGLDIYIDNSMSTGYSYTGYSYVSIDGSPTGSVAAATALVGPGLTSINFPQNFITEIEVYKIAYGAVTSPSTGPANVNNGIKLWLDASDVNATGSNSLSDGSLVSVWKDKSGAVNDATILAGESGGQIYGNQINGKSVVRFNRTNDGVGSVYQVNGVDIRAATNPQVTMFTVYKQGAHTQGQPQALWGNDDGNWDRFFYSSWDGDNGIASLGPVNPTFVAVPGSGVTNSLRLMTAVYDGTVTGNTNTGPSLGSAIYFNGAVVTTFTDHTDPLNAQPNLRIGWDGDNGAFNGDIAEMIVYNRKLSDCEIQTVNQYLSTKYGVTFTSAAITASGPTTFCQGGSVVLTASTGTAYQWNLNGNAITGATSATYNATASGDYTVAITSAGGCSATSAATTVTVNPLPIATISASGPTTICQGSAVTLTASVGASYLWSNGATTASINATTPGNYSVTVTNATNCSATSAATTVTVNPLPIASISASGSTTICQGSAVTLTATAGDTYLWSNGATTSSINATTAGNYSVTVTNATNCSATSAATTVTVNPLPIASISASGSTTICQGSAVTLTASAGASYLWSNGATTSSIDATTAGDYSVTITNATNCSATSAATTVIVSPLPIATASNSGPVTSGATISLSATGGDTYSWTGPNNFTSTLQNPAILNATTANAGTYTVTVSQNGCTATSSTDVVVNTTPAGALNFDGVNDYVTINNPFRAFNKEITVEWTANIDPTSVLGSGIGQSTANVDNNSTSNVWLMHNNGNGTMNFYVNDNGNWKTTGATIVAGWHHWTGVASASSIQLYMDGSLISSSSSGISSGIKNVANSVVQLGKDSRWTNRFMKGSIDEVRIWSRALCAGEIQNNLSGELTGTQAGLEEYYKFNQGNANDINTSVNTLTDASGNNRTGNLVNMALTGPASNWVVGNITGSAPVFVPPTASITASGATTFCPSGSVTLTANSGSGFTYQWIKDGAPINGQTNVSYIASASGSYNVILTKNGCTAAASPVAIVVQDLVKPVFTSTQANVTVALDGTGHATLANYAASATATDNCSVASITQSPAAGSALVNNIATTVTLTAKDPSGNIATQTFTVTATDQTAPVVITRNISVNLDATGNATITTGMINNGSTDNVGIKSFDLDKSTFDCSNVGTPVTVTLTATDASSNASTGTAIVTVFDVTPPLVPVLADVTGECSATATVATTTDVCAGTIAGTTDDPLTYTTQGTYTINWSFDDGHGNVSTGTQNVIVKDITPPVVPVLADVTGECSATATVPTATDNCSGVITGTTTDALSYSTQGTHVIHWSFNDGNGNISTSTQNVVIKDITPPVVPVLANVTGECSATATVPATTDNCSGVITGTTRDALSYTTQGVHVITWSFNDGNGNISTATQNVIIKDITAPVVPVLADVTGECSATATVPTTTDNCSGVITGTTTDALSYSTQGTHVIHWSFNDGNGNISTTTQNVVIKDITPPVVPVLANLTGECSATATVPTTTDNCSGVITGTTTDALSYSTQGTHVIHWSFNDGNGNVSTTTQNVIVKDITPPVVPVLADVTGECSATATVPTTTDNCAGIVKGTTTDPLTYTAQGTYVIHWSFNDGNGNVSTTTQNVIVKDVTKPVVKTQNITVQVGTNGTVSIVPSQINNGSYDNCGVLTYSLSKSIFDCSNIGVVNTVTLTADDTHGNVSTGTATVTVQDVIPPTVLTKNISVTLVNGTASITAAQVNNGSYDNCAIKSVSVSPSIFACGQYGPNTVTLTVVDNSGNTASQTATVTVIGVAPVPSIALSRTDNKFTGLPANTIALGYGAQSLTLTASNSTSAVGLSTFAWSPATGLSSTTAASPVFTPTMAGTYTFTVLATNQYGCKATTLVTIFVTDVRCGNKNDKVLVCHKTGSSSNPTVDICISPNAVATHLADGDKIGPCGASAVLTTLALPSITVNQTVAVAKTNEVPVITVKLLAYPNPFGKHTTVTFSVPVTQQKINLEVYNMMGNKVATLYTGKADANQIYQYPFDGTNLSPGSYFVRLTTREGIQVFKLVMVE